jgi:hypothetical protein
MYTQEKQDLINKKDWKGLLQTDILLDFSTDKSNYSFEFDFILDFIMNNYGTIFEIYKGKYGVNIFKDNIFNNVLKNVIKSSSASSKPNETQWEDFLISIYEISKMFYTRINDVNIFLLISTAVANKKIFELFLKPNNIEKIIGILKTLSSNVKIGELDSTVLSQEEGKKFLDTILKINEQVRHNILIENLSEFVHKFIKSDEEVIDYAKKSFQGVYVLIKDFPESRFLEFLINTSHNVEFTDLFKYVEEHPNLILPDEYLQRKFNTPDGNFPHYVIKFLTREQIIKFKDFLSPSLMVKNTKISLKEIKELKLKDSETIDFTNERFFTEEEIIQNPEFFDPKYVKDSAMVYISEEEFRKLNKIWGSRYHYDPNLSDFEIIFKNNIYRLDMSQIKYLAKRTKINNELLVNVIMKNNLYGSSLKDFIIFKKFLENYGI